MKVKIERIGNNLKFKSLITDIQTLKHINAQKLEECMKYMEKSIFTFNLLTV